jgi:hypothetical protein
MSILDIPDNFVITQQQVNEGWRLFGLSCGNGEGPKPTEEQLELADILMHAGEMHRTTNVWPTFSQTVEHWNAKWDRRLNNISRAHDGTQKNKD